MKRRELLLGAALASTARASEARVVRLPRHTTSIDPQLAYVSDLVKLALSKTGEVAEVRFAPLEMQQSRSLAGLLSGKAPFDLMWSMTSEGRERSGLLVIRFPIDRGLMGWRLLLARQVDFPKWQGVTSIGALQRFVAGQGHDWPDTAILKANGLRVETSTDYESLFRMLKAGRFDYMPRSINEIDAELADGKHPELGIVHDVMLYYPTAAYLFVSPKQVQLASMLEQGLNLSAVDGSFQRLFRRHFGALIERLPVQEARVLRLNNPLMPSPAVGDRSDLRIVPGQPLL